MSVFIVLDESADYGGNRFLINQFPLIKQPVLYNCNLAVANPSSAFKYTTCRTEPRDECQLISTTFVLVLLRDGVFTVFNKSKLCGSLLPLPLAL